MMTITRFAYSPHGTFSKVEIDSYSCVTIEPPWRENQTFISCIPEGWYKLKLRPSEVVERTTGGKYTEGFEILNVLGRTYIMFHPGNIMDDTEGCVCPGLDLGYYKGKWAVQNSMAAFDELMPLLHKMKDKSLIIKRGTL